MNKQEVNKKEKLYTATCNFIDKDMNQVVQVTSNKKYILTKIDSVELMGLLGLKNKFTQAELEELNIEQPSV